MGKGYVKRLQEKVYKEYSFVLLPLFCHLLFTWAFNLIILTYFALCVRGNKISENYKFCYKCSSATPVDTGNSTVAR